MWHISQNKRECDDSYQFVTRVKINCSHFKSMTEEIENWGKQTCNGYKLIFFSEIY